MGIYYNGLTSAKKMLNKRNPYIMAYVGTNLVHIGKTLYNYIDWKVDGDYIVIKASKPLATTLDIVFRIEYVDHLENTSTGAMTTFNFSERKYHTIAKGYNYQQTIAVSPSSHPSPPGGFVRTFTLISSVTPYTMYPNNDELHNFLFRKIT